jgi:glucose 1-dehydrogenase
MDMQLDGRVAVVTGSDSGIGRGIAMLFAEHGADVVVHYHSDRDGAEETASMVRAAGRGAAIVQADLGVEADVDRLYGELDDVFGRIDILVNAAGQGGEGLVHEMSTQVWDRVLRTNLYGPFYCSRHAARRMIERSRGGRIINISSVHEEACSAGGGAYAVSKAGLRNLTRTQAIELAEYGITVNDIAPGMILTPMNQAAMDDTEVRRDAEAQIPLRRAGAPADIAHMALFLASEAGSYCTGSTFFVDGGWLLTRPPV